MTGQKPALLSVIRDYRDENTVDTSGSSCSCIQRVTEICCIMSFFFKCRQIFDSLDITEQQAGNVEVSTSKRVMSKAWFCFRAGRITASMFKAALHTYLSQTS